MHLESGDAVDALHDAGPISPEPSGIDSNQAMWDIIMIRENAQSSIVRGLRTLRGSRVW